MRKLAFVLLILSCFLLGTWQGKATAKSRSVPTLAVAQLGGDPFGQCDHVKYYFYCRGEPGCNCIQINDYTSGCGDGANGRCCATCFRRSINTQ